MNRVDFPRCMIVENKKDVDNVNKKNINMAADFNSPEFLKMTEQLNALNCSCCCHKIPRKGE